MSILATGLTIGGIIAVGLAIAAFVGVARDARLSPMSKVMWILIVALFPIFGSIIYFGVRGDW